MQQTSLATVPHEMHSDKKLLGPAMLEEIAMEGRAAFLESGGKEFHYIPALNDDAAWITALAGIAERHLAGWPTRERFA